MQNSLNSRWDQVWIGAHIATMAPGATPYGALLDGAIALSGERIAWLGSAAEARQRAAAHGVTVHDARGLWITPGLIDCHTHLVYGGNRVAEFEAAFNPPCAPRAAPRLRIYATRRRCA